MSATEDDTELRDLLIQNLENNGVLNKLKAEMRAAVFLAMDEQDKVENKTPLVNENLKKCLNTKDGRLVASLIIDFLQVFNLDFTLAVFQPEINYLNGLDSREQVLRELGIAESDINRNTPLMLELVRRDKLKDRPSVYSEGDKATNIPKELSPRQLADARKKFDLYDKDRAGTVRKEDLKSVFGELFPNFNKNMLDKHIADELRNMDRTSSKTVDFQDILGLYKRLFSQCRSVVAHESRDSTRVPSRFIDEKMGTTPGSKIPRFKGHEHSGEERNAEKGVDVVSRSSGAKGSQVHVPALHSGASGDSGSAPGALKKGKEEEEETDEGDSFFDDPLPKPQKTYGCVLASGDRNNSGASQKETSAVRSLRGESLSGRSFSHLRRGTSLNDLSALGSDTEEEGEELFSGHKPSSVQRRADLGRAGGSPLDSLSDSAPHKSGAGGSLSRDHRELSGSRNGTSSKDKGFKDLKALHDKSGSLVLDDDVDYDDDFNSHRSDISKSEVSIGEEIEEVSIEGPDEDQIDESTLDLSVSQLSQSQGADYMEEVA
ncbi:centrosomal protein 43 [Aplochiton taeniatus]